MIGVSTHIDLEDVVAGFHTMTRSAKDLRPVWQLLKPVMQRDIRLNFTQRNSSDGSKWPDLAAATKDKRLKKQRSRAAKRGKRAPKNASKTMLGKLRNQFKIDFGARVIRARSRVDWSIVHEEGGTVGRGSVIPARDHMWVSFDFLKLVEDRIVAHVVRKF